MAKKIKPPDILTTKELRRHVAYLRNYCPVTKPVKIYRRKNLRKVPIEGPNGTSKEPVLGYCYKTKKYFVIVISKDQNADGQVETLRHEWAHLMAYPAQITTKSEWQHDAIWGLAYANVWREHVEADTEGTSQKLEAVRKQIKNLEKLNVVS